MTLLGRRVTFQPHLDTSSAQLVFDKALQFPGALLTKPGPPLTTEETSSFLGQLYQLMDHPAVPLSGKHEEKDITDTEQVTHVYVKIHGDKKSLSSKFQEPYKVISRPSRSRLQIQVGSYASREPRLQEFSWSSRKPASRPVVHHP